MQLAINIILIAVIFICLKIISDRNEKKNNVLAEGNFTDDQKAIIQKALNGRHTGMLYKNEAGDIVDEAGTIVFTKENTPEFLKQIFEKIESEIPVNKSIDDASRHTVDDTPDEFGKIDINSMFNGVPDDALLEVINSSYAVLVLMLIERRVAYYLSEHKIRNSDEKSTEIAKCIVNNHVNSISELNELKGKDEWDAEIAKAIDTINDCVSPEGTDTTCKRN